MTRSSLPAEELQSSDYDRIFAVLADCDHARDLAQFRESLLESLGARFGFRTTTFFTGDSFEAVWSDPAPLETRSSAGMLSPYQDKWYKHDIFASATSKSLLLDSRVAAISEMDAVSARAQAYLDQYLHRGGFWEGTAMYLDVANSRRAIVGIFEERPETSHRRRLRALRRLAGPLNAMSRSLSTGHPDARSGLLTRLTQRQRDVAELVSRGLQNSAIAHELCVSEDTVKKYVSAILAISGDRTRTQLALRLNADRF